MLTKFASLEVGEILEVKGSRERITGAGLDKLSSYEDYRTDDGYLYTRVRAISSRVNKNHDGWPSEELAKAYLTFIGKPIFVDHNNSDPTRARGVIVDAKLHIEDDLQKASALDPYYASAPENHKPPTWIELLLEVDAKAFPKLAKAIINDDIDGVSMGANVERSMCSHCANIATTPEEYCEHVMNKGATYDKFDDWGRKTAAPAYEDCYDIGFFEISYVFDPADPTALDMGGKRHASVEAGGKKKLKPSVKNQQNKQQQDRKRNEAEQAAFNEQQRKVRERSKEFAQRDWDDNKSFFAQPGEDYEAPAHTPGGTALGDPKPPTDGGWDVEKKYWVDPEKAPSTVAPDLKRTFSDPCPTCMGGVNRAGCPTCGGKGDIPTPKPEFSAPAPVQPSPYRQNAEEQAAAVPEDVRKVRMKQKKRVAPNRFQGGFFAKTAAGIDMGGFSDNMPSSAAGSGSPAPSPTLPGAQAQNCPQCGGAMENGVCPQCTAQAQGSDVGATSAGGNDPQAGMLSSFKIATGGQVHYADIIDDERAKFMNTVDENMAEGKAKWFQREAPKPGHPYGVYDWAPNTHDMYSESPFADETLGYPEEEQPDCECTERYGKPTSCTCGAAHRHHGAYSGQYPGKFPDDNPIEGDDTMDRILNAPPLDASEYDEAGLASPEDVSALVDRMEGMTPAQTADRAVLMSQNPEQAVDRLMQWGFRPEEAEAEVQAAIDRTVPEMAEPVDMPADPFKIAKGGAVHYPKFFPQNEDEGATSRAREEAELGQQQAYTHTDIADLHARIDDLQAQMGGMGKTADQAPLPQSMMTTAPEEVDTMRQEKICEVCGSDMEDGKCEVCKFEEPPEGFDNPDLSKAQEVAEMGAMDAGGAPGAAPGGAPGEPPPGVMAPPQGGGGAPGAGAPGPGAALSSTRKSSETPALTNERTAGKIRDKEQTILPATKTVSDHPKTTQVVKEPTRLTQSNTKATMTQIPTKAQVAAEMVRRGTFGVKTASEAEALLDEKGLSALLRTAAPDPEPASHNQDVMQVGGEVSNPEADTSHENVEKVQTIEKIHTDTWSDGEGDSLGQQSPVTTEAFPTQGGGPIGVPLATAATKTADGQSGVLGDPTNAEKQIDIDKPLQPEFSAGPETQTFPSDDFHVGEPITKEDGNQVGGPIGTPLSSVRSQIVAHVLSALKIAEQMVDQGLTPEEQKFELAAQLEQETPEELAVRRDMLAKTKTAGFRTQRTAAATPKLSRIVNSSRETGAQREVEDDNIGDSALFGR